MYNTKISIDDNNRCTKCGKKFANDEKIYRSDKSGKFYCKDCADEMTYNNSQDKSVGYLRRYFRISNFAVMALEYNTLSILEDGAYRIDMSYPCIEKFDEGSMSLWAEAYKKMTIGKSTVVEIRNGKPVWFFPSSMWAYKFDADADSDEYETAFSYVYPRSDIEECYFIIFMNKIVGITTKYAVENKDYYNISQIKMSSISYKELCELTKKNDLQRKLSSALKKLTPSVMLTDCQNRIQGQPMIKKAVFIIYSYLQALERNDLKAAENWLLTAPSGSGKTEFYRVIRDIFKEFSVPVPVIHIDLSLITEAGYKGNNVDSIHEKLLKADRESNGYCICFLDEADKKFIPSHSSAGEDVNSAVQSNLLTLVEGIDIGEDNRVFDTSRTMFVFLGSFQDIRDKRQSRHSKKSMGFGSEQENKQVFADKAGKGFYDDITLQEMIDFGMKEELAGRITRVINFRKIPENEMKELIRCKAYEIGDSMGYDVKITDTAVEEFLETAYGTLGVRRPMNIMRELIQDAVSEVFFDDDFNSRDIDVVIKSADCAEIKKHTKRRFIA